MGRSIVSMHSLHLLWIALFTVLFVTPVAHAQTINVSNIDIVSTPVPGSGHDYIKMLNETVNPANGSLSLRIEAPVARQRGNVNFPFYVFGYDSGGVSTPSAWVSWSTVNGFPVGSLNMQWTNSSLLAGGSTPAIVGLIPGGFVANAGIGQTFFQQNSLDVQVPYNQYAVCDFDNNYVYIDPTANRHAMNVGWITYSGSGNQQGCSAINVVMPGTSWGDAQYGITLQGTQDTSSFQTYVTDTDGRGSGVEDTNGNCCGATGMTTVANNQIASVAIPGLANPYKFVYGTATINYQPNSTLFAAYSAGSCPSTLDGQVLGGNSPTAVKSITLPNSTMSNLQQYVLGYDSTYGLLNNITYPTGAYVSYSWGVNPNSESLALGGGAYGTPFCQYEHDWPAIQKKIVSFDGIHQALEQDFAYTTQWSGTGSGSTQWTKKTTTVTTKDCTRASSCSTAPSFKTVYTYLPAEVGFGGVFSGQTPIENTIAYYDFNGSLIKTVTKNWNLISPPQLASECVTLPNGSTAGTFYAYAAYDVVSDKKEYDYGILSSNACAQGASSPTATPTRETKATYQSFPVTPLFPTPSMVDRPATVQIYDKGTLLAETDYAYDSYANGITAITAAGHDNANFPASYTNRGNATTKTVKCLQTTCVNAVTTYTGYDETGQILSSVDPNGNATGGTPSQHTTYYSYTDSWVSGDTYTSAVTPPATQVNAYLTTLTLPPTNGVSHIESFSYDYPSGQLTVSTDENLQPTKYRYDDYFARFTQSSYPDGGLTGEGYNDSPYNVTKLTPSITTTQAISSSLNKVSTAAFDGMGHTVETILSSDPDGPTYTVSTYDGTGKPYTVYNPTRCNPPTTNCGTEPTWGITTYTYDAMGRTTLVGEPDGSKVSTSYSSNQTTVTDETGNQRTSQIDGLGRLTNVWEAPNTSGYNFPTIYAYNALDDLTSVNQQGSKSGNARNRAFQYDSLSRLTSAANPESGTISYSYDANGNLITRAAPKANQTSASQNTTTTYSYDALNRLTERTHANPSTGKDLYAYDVAILKGCPGPIPDFIKNATYLIGRRTATCSPNSSSAWSYDSMGRPLFDARGNLGTAPAIYGTIGYTYYKDGSVNTLAYPSGNVLTFTVGGAGRPLGVSDSTYTYVASGSASYAPNGALTSMQNGLENSQNNTPAIVTTNVYNDRLQPVFLSAIVQYPEHTGVAPPLLQPFFSRCYDFHLGIAINNSPCTFGASTTGDNGNPFQIVDNVNTVASTAFKYDVLNRILQANTLATSGTGCWGEDYTIDAWGNLTNIAGVTSMPTCSTETLNAAPSSTANQLNGFCYDAAGNLVLNSPCPTGSFTPTYSYDSENRLSSTAGVTYDYDADGARVVKSSGTLYWPGQDGQVLTEANFSGLVEEEYVYFNGARIARLDTPLPITAVHYYFSDHLGSASVITDPSGNIQQQYYYYPYGGSESSTGSDPNRYKFTGKERDAESGLDMFGARYYGSSLGRFMTPDWAAKPTDVPYASFGNPQSLNLYSYVNNNPTTTRDPDGHCIEDACVVEGLLVEGGIAAWNYFAGAGVLGLTAAAAGASPSGNTGFVSPGYPSYYHGELQNADGTSIYQRSSGQSSNAQSSTSTQGQSTPAQPPEDGGGKDTTRAARREAMRQEGIPTSQQPSSQTSTEAGRQSTYEVPKAGGGTQTKIVTNQLKDENHGPHVEAGAPKANGQTDPSGRLRHANPKTKVDVNQ
jgi:RHS repeat-associated protein